MNNNPRFEASSTKSPEALRSDIDTTRQRMDNTIDALTTRLKGRHLVDEVLGFFRTSNGNGRTRAGQLGTRVADSVGTAMHSVADTIKAHPLPTVLIGAGIAWLIYEKARPSGTRLGAGSEYDPDYDALREGGGAGWEEDVPYDYAAGTGAYSTAELSPAESGYTQVPLTGAGATDEAESYTGTGESGGKLQNLKDNVGAKASAARDRLRQGGEQVRDTTAQLREKARQRAEVMRQRLQTGYTATRQRVASTVDEHPLGSAFACLAMGVVAGMLLPTPRAVTEAARPTADRLRQRARDASRELVERGKHIAQAATDAARQEAEAQGLTPEALKDKAGAVAGRAREAATETAQKEGVTPGSMGGGPAGGNNPQPTTPGAQTGF